MRHEDISIIGDNYYSNHGRLVAVYIEPVGSWMKVSKPTYAQVLADTSNLVWVPGALNLPKLIEGLNTRNRQAICVIKQALCIPLN